MAKTETTEPIARPAARPRNSARSWDAPAIGRPPRVIDLRSPEEIEAWQQRVVRKRGLLAILTLALLQFGDVITTDALSGHAEEANPFAAFLLDRAALLPVKLAIVAFLGAVFLFGWRQIRPRVVTIIWVVVAVYGIVVISNAVQYGLVRGGWVGAVLGLH